MCSDWSKEAPDHCGSRWLEKKSGLEFWSMSRQFLPCNLVRIHALFALLTIYGVFLAREDGNLGQTKSVKHIHWHFVHCVLRQFTHASNHRSLPANRLEGRWVLWLWFPAIIVRGCSRGIQERTNHAVESRTLISSSSSSSWLVKSTTRVSIGIPWCHTHNQN
jgi:hypothetical protein